MLIVVPRLGRRLHYVTREAKIVQERAEIMGWMKSREMLAGETLKGEPIILRGDWLGSFDDSKRTWLRRLLNDHYVQRISYRPGVSPDDVDRVKAAFPEASVSPCEYRVYESKGWTIGQQQKP